MRDSVTYFSGGVLRMSGLTSNSSFHEVAFLGMGGMGGVSLAVSMGMGGFTKLLVVKRLRPEIADNPDFLSMFLQEAKLSARLNHPNIVQTYEIGSDATSHFLTMEYLEGQSLHDTLRAARGLRPALDAGTSLSEPTPLAGPRTARPSGPPSTARPSVPPSDVDATGKRRGPTMPLPFYLRALCDAMLGLDYAHRLCDHSGAPLNIVHRDVNPGNIFLTYGGTVKLLDFGIAKAADSSLNTRTGMLKGKVAYLAPEQLRPGRHIDRRADIFAVGVMLWEAATGQRMWRGVSDLEILTRLSKGQLPRLGDYAPDVHPRLEAVCSKAMAINPDDRYATAAELGDALEAVLDEVGSVSSRELGAYVSELFVSQRATMQAFVRRRLDELRVAYGAGAPSTMRPPADDSRLGPLPLTISRPVQRQSRAPAPARRATAAFALAGALGVMGAALWARHREAPAQPTPTAAATAAEPRPTAVAVQSLNLTLSASPADATIFVDDVPVLINPYADARPADGRKHLIRVEAPGYGSQSKTVEFLGPDLSFHFTLERREAGGRPSEGSRGSHATPRTPAPAPAPAPARPPDPNPRGKGRELDRENPWQELASLRKNRGRRVGLATSTPQALNAGDFVAAEDDWGQARSFLVRHLLAEFGKGRTAVITIPAPFAPLETFLKAAPRDMSVLWHPAGEAVYACAGAAYRLELRGKGRFEQLRRGAAAVWENGVQYTYPGLEPPTPRLFGGVAFGTANNELPPWDEFADGSFTLPRWTYARAGGEACLSLAVGRDADGGLRAADEILGEAESIFAGLFAHEWAKTVPTHYEVLPPVPPEDVKQLPPSVWREHVAAALEAIRAGRFQKVVAARRCEVTLPAPVDDAVVLARLAAEFPDAAVRFAFRRARTTLVGASPERLFVKRGDSLLTTALAGTIRSNGSDFPHASAQAARLLASNKDLAEHAFVAEQIAAKLRPLSARVERAGQPGVMRIRDLLHLETPIEATLRPEVEAVDVLSALHPTAAVGGFPTEQAVAFIEGHEPHPRGWYTGTVGWLDAAGDASFVVVIRSGLLSEGRRAYVYTGAGIVQNSDPDAEYEETALKQRPILSALGVEPP
jgi:eukaryotic-like serine/threonine-protein kinase